MSRRPQLKNRETRLQAAADSAATQLVFKMLAYGSQGDLASGLPGCLAAIAELTGADSYSRPVAFVQVTTGVSWKQMIYMLRLDFWLFLLYPVVHNSTAEVSDSTAEARNRFLLYIH